MQIFYVPCPDAKIAENLATTLLQEKWIACANMLPPMRSFYWWKEKIENSAEVALILKTDLSPERLEKMKDRVKQLHPYQIHCLLELQPQSINPEYLGWMQESLK